VWTKTDIRTSLYRLNPYRPGGSGTAHQLVQMVFSEYHLTSWPGYCIKLREEMNGKDKCQM